MGHMTQVALAHTPSHTPVRRNAKPRKGTKASDDEIDAAKACGTDKWETIVAMTPLKPGYIDTCRSHPPPRGSSVFCQQASYASASKLLMLLPASFLCILPASFLCFLFTAFSLRLTRAHTHAHTYCRHFFEVKDGRRYTHIRVNYWPDGGVARLRVFGEVQKVLPRCLAALLLLSRVCVCLGGGVGGHGGELHAYVSTSC